jgi:hypothetical protein
MSLEGLTSGIICRFHKAYIFVDHCKQPPALYGVGAFLLPRFTIEWFNVGMF